MINDETVRKLIKICDPCTFKKGEYICYEGQTGKEMYVVLKGSVGVYIMTAAGTVKEAAVIQPGGFFGEMSIFDDLPRSASCVALEDTTCIAINKGNLEKFINDCPEVTAKIIENMSGRIRRLNNELFKSERFTEKPVTKKDFKIPEAYRGSHSIKEPLDDNTAVVSEKCECPICHSWFTVSHVRYNVLTLKAVDRDRRPHYIECDPIWYDVWSCPNCHYSNYYKNFFNVAVFNIDIIDDLINDRHIPVINEMKDKYNSPFDRFFINYLQAIDINEHVNRGDYVLIGRLWLNLHWLFEDAGDSEMAEYCADNAIENLISAYEKFDKFLKDDFSRQCIAITIAELLYKAGRNSESEHYCNEALRYSDPLIKKDSFTLKNLIGGR